MSGMRMSRSAGVCAGLAVVVGIVVSMATGTGPTARANFADGYKPVADLDVVMHFVDDVYSEFEGQVESKKFRTLAKGTKFLAELMNLTSVYDHKEYAETKGWKEISVKVRDQLLEAADIAKKKDGAAMTAALKKIDATCESCHEKYRDI